MNGTQSRELGSCLAWIAVIFLLGATLLFLSAPLRRQLLVDDINKVLRDQKLSYSLAVPKDVASSVDRRSTFMGQFYSLDGQEGLGVVYPITVHGLGAYIVFILDSKGAVSKVIPLSENSRRLLEMVSPGMIEFYSQSLSRKLRTGEVKE